MTWVYEWNLFLELVSSVKIRTNGIREKCFVWPLPTFQDYNVEDPHESWEEVIVTNTDSDRSTRLNQPHHPLPPDLDTLRKNKGFKGRFLEISVTLRSGHRNQSYTPFQMEE